MGSAGVGSGDTNVLSRVFFYGANSFLFSFPFANTYARMSRYFELPSLSLQSPHWTTWAEVFPVKESFEHFKLFGYKENILSAKFKLLLCQSGQRYGSGAHNRLNITFVTAFVFAKAVRTR